MYILIYILIYYDYKSQLNYSAIQYKSFIHHGYCRGYKKNLPVHMCVLYVFCVTNVIYVTLRSSISTKHCIKVKKYLFITA
jgi:hypothetical protein